MKKYYDIAINGREHGLVYAGSHEDAARLGIERWTAFGSRIAKVRRVSKHTYSCLDREGREVVRVTVKVPRDQQHAHTVYTHQFQTALRQAYQS